MVRETQWPIMYSPVYNIGFLGLEKLHPFDAGKWGRIFNYLKGEDYDLESLLFVQLKKFVVIILLF